MAHVGREEAASSSGSAALDRDPTASAESSSSAIPFTPSESSIFLTTIGGKRTAFPRSPVTSSVSSCSESSPTTTVSSAAISAASKTSPKATSSPNPVSVHSGALSKSKSGTASASPHGASTSSAAVTSAASTGSSVAASSAEASSQSKIRSSAVFSKGSAGVTFIQATSTVQIVATSSVAATSTGTSSPTSLEGSHGPQAASSSSSPQAAQPTVVQNAVNTDTIQESSILPTKASTTTSSKALSSISAPVDFTSSVTQQAPTTQVFSAVSQTGTATAVSQATSSATSGGNSGSGSSNPGLNPSNALSPAKSNTGAVAGGVVGGLAILALLAFLAMFLLRRRRRRLQDDRFSAQVLANPHTSMFRFPSNNLSSTSRRGWDVTDTFFRPMEEPGFRVVARAPRKSDASSRVSVPSVSEDPFWDPSQVRPLAIIPATPPKQRAGGAPAIVVDNPFEDPQAGPSVGGAANPFLDPLDEVRASYRSDILNQF
ncbi:hypothetical protein HWV62_1827 [Athelia sp. TMB]|nr:hypothetical protein HWV62_1827 [Athelia sp. TMB]